MKKGIHPEFQDAVFRCACGAEIATRSAKPEYRLEICSSCHPFFTGKQKLIDSAGRVDRFLKKYGDKPISTGKKAAKPTARQEKQVKIVKTKTKPVAAPKKKAPEAK